MTPSDGWVGETHQEFNRIKIRLVGFTRPTTDPVAVNEERGDLSAALALAATVAGEFYFPDPTGLQVLKKCRVSGRRHFCHPTSF